jgi:predicted RNA-binding protein with PIN domain
LYNEIEQIEKHINLDVKSIQNQKPAARIQLSNQVAEIFEKWRRGQR